ncbi:MAG: NAD-binding protein [Firmicutes bacterium]|nr:NAD-binding protein [Bacillota bacterium]
MVLGAGAVGLEFGRLYHRLGSEVPLVEAQHRILPREDAEVGAFLDWEGGFLLGVFLTGIARRFSDLTCGVLVRRTSRKGSP